MFFMVPKNTAKQLKLRDPSEGLAPMLKLAFDGKIYSMHKIISLYLYLGCRLVYRQRGKGQPELGFLLLLDLGVLSEFYLEFDPLVQIWYNPRKFKIKFGLGVISRFYRE
jgi:hypothetical protein